MILKELFIFILFLIYYSVVPLFYFFIYLKLERQQQNTRCLVE